MGGGRLYSGHAQRRLPRVRSPMAPQDTPERGAKASRHRRPTLYSGDSAGVPKHPSSGNGGGFADARLGAGYLSAPAAYSDANSGPFAGWRWMRTRRITQQK
jgi:hypothetical protein